MYSLSLMTWMQHYCTDLLGGPSSSSSSSSSSRYRMGPSESVSSSSLSPGPPPSGMTLTLGSSTRALRLRGSSSGCRGGLWGWSFRNSSSMSKSSSSGLWGNTAVRKLHSEALLFISCYVHVWEHNTCEAWTQFIALSQSKGMKLSCFSRRWRRHSVTRLAGLSLNPVVGRSGIYL